jgi:hypothetical protein
MTAEVYLNAEQEEKFFTIYHKRDLSCTNQELVQDLFNEALTANYLLYGKGNGEAKTETETETEYRLVSIEFTDDNNDISEEEKAEIMREIWESEENESTGN